MSHPDWVGRTLGGRYRLEAMVGHGGMASVYRGFDPNLNRRVAVKLIHSHLTSDPRFVRRFEAEAAAVAGLRHPNIIQVYDFSHDGPTYYMVLDYLPGETLHARLNKLSQAGQRLPVPEAAAIAATIAEAVHYAHARGLVHRDIKPANIMLEPDGRVILMDFGIAKVLDATGVTETGNVLGTAKYMAPELVLGQAPSPRSDIYSLGIMLFEMVAGEPPFDADSVMGLLHQHVHQPLPDLTDRNPAAPPELEAVVEQALQKDPAQRFATAQAMAAALRTAASAPPPANPTASRANDPTVVDAHLTAPPAQPPIAARQPPPPTTSRANSPTVVDAPLPAPQPSASVSPVRPASLEPSPAASSNPNAPPPASPSQPRRSTSLVPLIALAAASLGLLVCLALAASGGLLGLATVRGWFSSATPTSPVEDVELYAHASGAFTLSLPEGWQVIEGETGVSAYPPDQSAQLRIDFTHVGTRLSQAGLEAFVTAVETNYFAGFRNYQSDGLTAQPDGRITVLKTLAVPNGPPQTVFSQTWQDGLVVYEQHLWVPTRDYDRLIDSLLEVAATAKTDSATAASALPYVAAYTFSTPDAGIEFAVPYAWAYRTHDNADGHVDEFASPDETTFIGSVAYTATQTFAPEDAAAFATYLLQEYYASDRQVTAEDDAGDGRTRLAWHSPSRGIDGVSYYETRGAQFFMLNWTVAAGLKDLYRPVWERVMSTYHIP